MQLSNEERWSCANLSCLPFLAVKQSQISEASAWEGSILAWRDSAKAWGFVFGYLEYRMYETYCFHFFVLPNVRHIKL